MLLGTPRRSAGPNSITSPGPKKLSAATFTARYTGALLPQASPMLPTAPPGVTPHHPNLSMRWPPCLGGRGYRGDHSPRRGGDAITLLLHFPKDPAAQAGAGAVAGRAQHLGVHRKHHCRTAGHPFPWRLALGATPQPPRGGMGGGRDWIKCQSPDSSCVWSLETGKDKEGGGRDWNSPWPRTR